MKSGRKLAMMLATVVVGTSALAGDPAASFGMRGTIGYDRRTEVNTYNFKIGNRANHYSVEGMTKPIKGIYYSDIGLEAVEVVRHDGNKSEVEACNGTLRVYPRKRFLYDMTIAGVPLKGQYLSGAINLGYFLDGLEVDGEDSRGLIDYNSFVGYYRSKRGARFGNSELASTLPGSNVMMNRDNYIGQNINKISMIFGNLKLEGVSYRSDTEQVTEDSDGNTSTTVVASTSRYDVAITKKDGSAVVLAPVGESLTADDKEVRKLIAMFVLLF